MGHLSRESLNMVVLEDDENDLFFLKRALNQGGFVNPFKHFKGGNEAIAYFEQLQKRNTSLPDVVLMDIKMPGRNGLDVLKWLRVQSSFQELPVVMLTSSNESSDITKSGQLGIFRFLTKRIGYDNLISALDEFLAMKSRSHE